jgi:hypothetical protein
MAATDGHDNPHVALEPAVVLAVDVFAVQYVLGDSARVCETVSLPSSI